ncbi:hypothetical protein Tsubulata_033610 [Turnera subulata]|uniref:F-box domain-containing protein n=1 Tax=Turnera subulata TaxID=218843 RepID=A0A9Q0JRA9_9ROSI|nr:hypothetical protein Tsubulata_033610 [Turnera subulata]
MADKGNMLSSKKKKNISSWRSSKKRKRKESSDDIAAMEKKKHNKTRAPNNGLLVDPAKSTNTEQLVISTTNVAAPDHFYLPTDIVEEIIDLLPMKSINRFRSVSKSLFTLLATKFNVPKLIYCPFITNFSPSNYGIKSSDNPCRFTGVVLSDYSGHAKNQGYTAPVLSRQIVNAMPLLPLMFYCFIGSCNGLVCMDVSNDYGTKWETIVWNPFTGIFRKLPHRNHKAYGFGYDSASDDYKVFAGLGDGEVEIFSMKKGCWKKVENIDREYLQYIQWLEGKGLFLNGALHWRPRESSQGGKGEIVAFDLGKEKFYYVPSPPNDQISRGYGPNYSLGVVGEYLCFLHRDGNTNIVWAMKEYCNEASWVPFISYTCSAPRKCKVDDHLTYVCDFIPRSFKDSRYMMLEFSQAGIHVLKWNNNLDDSDEAEKYSKKIEFQRVLRTDALPYTETLTSPYAS